MQRIRSRWHWAGAVATVTLAAFLAVPGDGRAGDDEDEHLDYRTTYEEAMLEARIRNVPIFVSRHKDF
ncbi:MAG: hypothetical protein ACYTG6_14170 [Planctomycetota bacterium]|jgi:hypothetical protein